MDFNIFIYLFYCTLRNNIYFIYLFTPSLVETLILGNEIPAMHARWRITVIISPQYLCTQLVLNLNYNTAGTH